MVLNLGVLLQIKKIRVENVIIFANLCRRIYLAKLFLILELIIAIVKGDLFLIAYAFEN